MPRRKDLVDLPHQGFSLSPEAAAVLESRLKECPSDLPCRLKLLGYYWRWRHGSKSAASKHLASVVWMIRRMPELEVLGDPYASVDSPQGAYEKCKKTWLAQISKNKESVPVITNAASFLRFDLRLAETLYRKAIILDPENPAWSRDLAWRLRLGAKKNSARLKRAFVAIQDAIRKTDDPASKRYLYDYLAEIAFNVSEWSIAEKAAKKSVAEARKYGNDWYVGNAIHDGNCILGRLALRNGKIKKAIFHLVEAGKTDGSPQLNSFGPNMQFAQEMLHVGQRRAVIRYLEACKRFWKGREKLLSDCIDEIEKGESPKLPRVR